MACAKAVGLALDSDRHVEPTNVTRSVYIKLFRQFALLPSHGRGRKFAPCIATNHIGIGKKVDCDLWASKHIGADPEAFQHALPYPSPIHQD